MSSIEQALTVLSLNPDKSKDVFTDARMEWSRAMNERYEMFREDLSHPAIASPKPFRDYGVELSAPIEIYQKNESGKFVAIGSLSLNDVYRIEVHTSFVEPDTEGRTTTLLSDDVRSVQREAIWAELRRGGYSQIATLEISRGLSSYHVIEKEFIPITFQRTPDSPIEQAFVRCTSRDETHLVPFKREDITPSDPDYPGFQDPMLLERTTIRTSPIR